LSESVSLCCGQSVDLTLDGEDRVDLVRGLDRQGRFGNIGELEQLAPAMCPTRRFGDRARLACRRIESLKP
jgi:hypothetical protein